MVIPLTPETLPHVQELHCHLSSITPAASRAASPPGERLDVVAAAAQQLAGDGSAGAAAAAADTMATAHPAADKLPGDPDTSAASRPLSPGAVQQLKQLFSEFDPEATTAAPSATSAAAEGAQAQQPGTSSNAPSAAPAAHRLHAAASVPELLSALALTEAPLQREEAAAVLLRLQQLQAHSSAADGVAASGGVREDAAWGQRLSEAEWEQLLSQLEQMAAGDAAAAAPLGGVLVPHLCSQLAVMQAAPAVRAVALVAGLCRAAEQAPGGAQAVGGAGSGSISSSGGGGGDSAAPLAAAAAEAVGAWLPTAAASLHSLQQLSTLLPALTALQEAAAPPASLALPPPLPAAAAGWRLSGALLQQLSEQAGRAHGASMQPLTDQQYTGTVAALMRLGLQQLPASFPEAAESCQLQCSTSELCDAAAVLAAALAGPDAGSGAGLGQHARRMCEGALMQVTGALFHRSAASCSPRQLARLLYAFGLLSARGGGVRASQQWLDGACARLAGAQPCSLSGGECVDLLLALQWLQLRPPRDLAAAAMQAAAAAMRQAAAAGGAPAADAQRMSLAAFAAYELVGSWPVDAGLAALEAQVQAAVVELSLVAPGASGGDGAAQEAAAAAAAVGEGDALADPEAWVSAQIDALFGDAREAPLPPPPQQQQQQQQQQQAQEPPPTAPPAAQQAPSWPPLVEAEVVAPPTSSASRRHGGAVVPVLSEPATPAAQALETPPAAQAPAAPAAAAQPPAPAAHGSVAEGSSAAGAAQDALASREAAEQLLDQLAKACRWGECGCLPPTAIEP